jgi:hypothetical protein
VICARIDIGSNPARLLTDANTLIRAGWGA